MSACIPPYVEVTYPNILFQLKPHGSIYGMTAHSIELARSAVGVAKLFNVAFMGLAGTCHEQACEESGVKFIAGRFSSS